MQEFILDPIRNSLDSFVRLAGTPDPAAGAAPTDAPDVEFEARIRDAAPLAFRVARGVLRNSADAEDVCQEALLRAFRRFHRLRDPQRFRGWLVRIAFRIALDRGRSAKRRQQREMEWMYGPSLVIGSDLAIRVDFQLCLEAALAELPEKLRLVLLLSAMEGNSLEEISALIGVPVGTVKSRLFYARKKLAEKLR